MFFLMFSANVGAAEYTVQTPKSAKSILGVPSGTVAQMLLLSSPQDGWRYDVNNGLTMTDCGVGTGTFDVQCCYNDSTWEHCYGGTGPVAVTLESFAGRGLTQDGVSINMLPDKVTSDPCGTYPEAAIFYNDTADILCLCDGNGDDIKITGGACF